MNGKKRVKAVNEPKEQGQPKQARMRSKAARTSIAEGTRLFVLAGRPTKAQFVKVYGQQGPKMTWEQWAKAGVDAKHKRQARHVRDGLEYAVCLYGSHQNNLPLRPHESKTGPDSSRGPDALLAGKRNMATRYSFRYSAGGHTRRFAVSY